MYYCVGVRPGGHTERARGSECGQQTGPGLHSRHQQPQHQDTGDPRQSDVSGT